MKYLGKLPTAATDVALYNSVTNSPSYAVNPLNRYDPTSYFYNFKPSNTRRWRAGLAKAGNGGVGAELWIGDSLIGGCNSLVGSGQTDTSIWDRLHAVPRQYEHIMALSGIPILSTGKVKAYDNGHIDSRWSLTSSWASAQTATQVSAAGQVATYTSTTYGTQVSVTWYDYGSASDPFNIAVNGATSGVNFLQVTPAATHTWKRAVLSNVVGLVPGSTVTITTTTATLMIFSDIEIRNGTTGLVIHNSGLSGASAAGTGYLSWSEVGSGYDPIQQFSPSLSPNFLPELPSVVHCGLLYFDVMNGNSVSAYTTALTSIRNQFPNSDFVLHATPWPAISSLAAWTPYLTALYGLADTLDVPLLDLQDCLGGYTTESSLGIAGDTTVHLLVPGYALWGAAAASLVRTDTNGFNSASFDGGTSI